MSPAPAPGFSSFPCCSWDLSIVDVVSGAGAEPVTAAFIGAWPGAGVGNGSVAMGAFWPAAG